MFRPHSARNSIYKPFMIIGQLNPVADGFFNLYEQPPVASWDVHWFDHLWSFMLIGFGLVALIMLLRKQWLVYSSTMIILALASFIWGFYLIYTHDDVSRTIPTLATGIREVFAGFVYITVALYAGVYARETIWLTDKHKALLTKAVDDVDEQLSNPDGSDGE